MHEFAFQAWEGFYVIVGTSAGALTGLQFVVMTLISESGRVRGTKETVSAFSTPNVVHFCASLLVSAIMTAPWPGPRPAGVALALCGMTGILYCVAILRRARRQRDYKPVLEDWIWHVALPILAYVALILAGARLTRVNEAAFAVGGVTLLLVFIGIHNAWDTVTYVMVDRTRVRDAKAARTVESRAASVSALDAAGEVEPAEPPQLRDP
jgi:hypothetical protein